MAKLPKRKWRVSFYKRAPGHHDETLFMIGHCRWIDDGKYATLSFHSAADAYQRASQHGNRHVRGFAYRTRRKPRAIYEFAVFGNTNLKRGTMATKAFHIELRATNVNTEEHMQALIKAVQRAGQLLHADATMILGDNPAPEINLYGEDFIEGRTNIKVT